jgi:hypothetical protein
MSDEVRLYYMRDNHTFKRLTGHVDEMMAQCMADFDDGFSGGMLCTKSIPDMGTVHAHGPSERDQFMTAARKWLTAAYVRSNQP